MRSGTDPAVLPVVAPVLRDLTARRLARTGVTHLLVTLTALLELAVGPGRDWTRAGALVGGAAVSAGALLLAGWAGVRRGAGAPPVGWLRWAGAAGVLPWAFGLWVFGVVGLRGIATASGVLPRVAVGLVYAALGLGVLRDAVRVREVGQLGRFMALPAPEETGS